MTYTALDFPGQTVVIVSAQDVRLQGTYSGVITLVAGHHVKINGPLIAADSSSYLAAISFDTITIDVPASTAEGGSAG